MCVLYPGWLLLLLYVLSVSVVVLQRKIKLNFAIFIWPFVALYFVFNEKFLHIVVGVCACVCCNLLAFTFMDYAKISFVSVVVTYDRQCCQVLYLLVEVSAFIDI